MNKRFISNKLQLDIIIYIKQEFIDSQIDILESGIREGLHNILTACKWCEYHKIEFELVYPNSILDIFNLYKMGWFIYMIYYMSREQL